MHPIAISGHQDLLNTIELDPVNKRLTEEFTTHKLSHPMLTVLCYLV